MATGKALNGKPYAGNPHVRFDEGEVASAATPRRGFLLYTTGKKLRLTVIVAAAIISSVALGETYSWKYVTTRTSADNTPPASPAWHSFGDYNNWAVGTTYTGDNPNAAVPGADDAIYFGKVSDYYRKIACFDLGGNPYTVKDILGGTSQWVPYLMLLTNGTFTVTGSFTNNSTHVHLYNGGKFVHGPECVSICGSGDVYTLWHVHEGGEADIGGRIRYLHLHMVVDSGGTLTLRPEQLAIDSSADKYHDSYLHNSGTLNLPEGLTVDGVWTPSGPCNFIFEQKDGILNLGGNLVRSEYTDGSYNRNDAHFVLEGGTVNVTNDVSFERFTTVLMTNDAVATVNVAAGKTFDLSTMTFAAGTSITKTGAGTLKLGASVPESISVEGGTLAASAAASFGDISLSPGVTLHVASAGVSFGAISGIASANITFASSLTGSIASLLASSDPATLSALLERLDDAPEGWEYRVHGNMLFIDKIHDPAVFYWKKEIDGQYNSFLNTNWWGVGKTSDSANSEGLVPGPDDEIYYGNAYQRYLYFDMGNTYRTVKGLANGFNPSSNTYGFCNIKVRNGTLEFSECFTNVRAIVTADSGGRFILGERCATLAGYGGAQNTYTAEAGGELDIGGDLCMHIFQASVKNGGRMVFHPSRFTYHSGVGSGALQSFISNSGSLELPDGITLGGASQGGCTFTIAQQSGEMVLGGDVKMMGQIDYLDFNLTGGTVRVTADAAFVGCRSVVMTNDAAAEIAVDTGKTADFSAMVFREGTALSKTGDGTLKISASVPQSLDVQAGTLAVAGAAAFGEGLSLGDGATLHFAVGGSSAGAIPGLNDATVTLDPQSVGYGSAIISSTNVTLIASVAEKLAPAIAAADKPKLSLMVEVQAGDPAVNILRLIRVPKGMVFSFK